MDPEVIKPLFKSGAAELNRNTLQLFSFVLHVCNTSSGDQDVSQLRLRFDLRSIFNIPPVYPPPRPVNNMSVCLLPGCGGKFVHNTKKVAFPLTKRHQRTRKPSHIY
jgi:hypothetical protein